VKGEQAVKEKARRYPFNKGQRSGAPEARKTAGVNSRNATKSGMETDATYSRWGVIEKTQEGGPLSAKKREY